MKITVKKSVTHSMSNYEKENVNTTHDTEAVKQLFVDVLKNKNEYDESKLKWDGKEDLAVQDISSIALHNFYLEVEKLGKKIKLENRTVIQVVD
ncbi:MAG: hypothetical protein JXR03_06055 [Cyclobacteriaceae bacterium]